MLFFHFLGTHNPQTDTSCSHHSLPREKVLRWQWFENRIPLFSFLLFLKSHFHPNDIPWYLSYCFEIVPSFGLDACRIFCLCKIQCSMQYLLGERGPLNIQYIIIIIIFLFTQITIAFIHVKCLVLEDRSAAINKKTMKPVLWCNKKRSIKVYST